MQLKMQCGNHNFYIVDTDRKQMFANCRNELKRWLRERLVVMASPITVTFIDAKRSIEIESGNETCNAAFTKTMKAHEMHAFMLRVIEEW